MSEAPRSPAQDESSAQARRVRRTRPLTSTQVIFAAVVAIGLMLTINFSSRIVADRDLQEIRRTVIQEIDLLKREQATLIDQLAYAGSDAYVEDWARSDGKMVREGDILVRPIPSNTFVENTQITQQDVAFVSPETRAPDPVSWHLWWALFFDTPPPQF